MLPSYEVIAFKIKMQNVIISHTRKIYSFAHGFPLYTYVYMFLGNNVLLFVLRIPAAVFVMSCMLFPLLDT